MKKASLVQREVSAEQADGGIVMRQLPIAHKRKSDIHNPPVKNQRFLPAPFTQGGLFMFLEL